MAKVKNIDGTGYLKDGNGNFIDSSLFENDPLDSTLDAVNKIPESEIDKLIDELFPDLKPEKEPPE